MSKLIGKEINAILGAQSILIWPYECFSCNRTLVLMALISNNAFPFNLQIERETLIS